MKPASADPMTQLNHAAARLIAWTVLALLIACSIAEFPAAQTASPSANRRRAQFTRNLVTSTANAHDPSSLGAISASVDAGVDRRVNADRQNELMDPSLPPLRIIAPNVNGEDEASAQTPTQTPTPSTGGRAKYSAFTAIPQSTAGWNPRRMDRSQRAPVLRGQFPVHSLKGHHLATHGSDRAGHMENNSLGSPPFSGAERNLGSTRAHRSNLTDSRKAHYQQESRRRECSQLYLSELECRALLRQQRVSISRRDPTQSFRGSLAAIR